MTSSPKIHKSQVGHTYPLCSFETIDPHKGLLIMFYILLSSNGYKVYKHKYPFISYNSTFKFWLKFNFTAFVPFY